MKIKRVLQGTALTAFAAIAWFGAGSAGASAAVTIRDVEFDEEDISLKVKFDGPELIVGMAKVDKNRKAKVTAWDVYDSDTNGATDEAKIDLSKLNVTKDNYIAIMTNDMEEPLYIKLGASVKKNTITFHADTARITGFKADGKEVERIEYRRITDAWGASGKISELDWSAYQYQGASLYVRVPGIDRLEDITGTDDKAYDDIKEGQVDINTISGASAINVDVYNIGSLPGKETKLNIAKQANGPSVPVDYTKGTVTINKGLEFRVIKESGTTTYSAIGSKEVKSVAKLLEATGTAQKADAAIVEVRKAAVSTGKGKSASKWTRVKIENPKELEIDTSKTKDISEATVEQPVTIATTSGVIMEAAYKLNSKNTAVTYLILTNKSEDNYEYFIGSDVPAVGAKGIKSIKKGKAANIKPGDASGKNIYIRLAGDKKAKKWAGAWKQVGTGIKVPEITVSK